METTERLTRTKWTLDPSHSEIGFKVKHLMVTNVRGEFKDYEANVYTKGEDFENAEIEIWINARSVTTNDSRRDGHLRSADFFDVENFKEIIFKSSSFKRTSKNDYVLSGDLRIKDVTKRIEFDVEFNGIVKDPYGSKRAGFEITGRISRKDFGLTWNAALETGGVVVGDEINIKCEIQLTQQSE